MNRDNNILCIGELLIDFICSDIDVDLVKGVNFVKRAGGAPANVTAAISKLGGSSSFLGKVGNDPFGIFLKKTLDDVGVDTSSLLLDREMNTTFAYVSLKGDGERDFVFNRGADENLKPEEIDNKTVENSKIIHFGSATALLGGNIEKSYNHTMKIAKDKDKIISFDPNYRVDLWKGRIDEFITKSKEFIALSDFVKVSDEEIKLISGKEELEAGVEEFHRLGAGIVAVTLGKEGTLISKGEVKEKIQSIKINSIDSTGAGDAFVGGLLYKIAQLENPKELINEFEILKQITVFANKVGAITCTKLGAIDSLPSLGEIK